MSNGRILTKEGKERFDSTVNKGRFQGRVSKKSLPRTSRRKHKQVSGCKNPPGRSAESWFHSESGQPEMVKEVGRRRAHS